MRKIEVVAAVIHHDGKVLVSRRRNDGKLEAGKLENPGGKIEDGEAPEDALAREIEEELGMRIEVGSLYFEHTHDFDTDIETTRIHFRFYDCATNSDRFEIIEVADAFWSEAERLKPEEFTAGSAPVIEKQQNAR